jgi:hypothetical protein
MTTPHTDAWDWKAWKSDPAISLCGYAAKGLWIEMLCYMGANDEYGYLTKHGKPLTVVEIGKLTGGNPKEVAGLILELERARVFSRDARKVIYCRRMARSVRDAGSPHDTVTSSVSGIKTQEKAAARTSGVSVSTSSVPRENKKGSKIQTPERELALVDGSDWPKDYQDQFWSRYPRRTEKKAAMAKLDAIRRHQTVAFADLMAGVDRYIAYTKGTEERYIKHPTTWLNRGCWDDEHAKARADQVNGHSRNGFAELISEMQYGDRHA